MASGADFDISRETAARADVEGVWRDLARLDHGKLTGRPHSRPLNLVLDTWARISQLNPNAVGMHLGPLGDGQLLAHQRAEAEVMAWTAALVGLTDPVVGYLASGGTEGNLFALWVARNRVRTSVGVGRPSIRVLTTRSAHHSVAKACDVLGLDVGTWLRCEHCGGTHDHRVDDASTQTLEYVDASPTSHEVEIDALIESLDHAGRANVDGVVFVANRIATVSGATDDLRAIADALDSAADRYGLTTHLHVDASYGGLVIPFLDAPTSRFEDDLKRADSVVIDWHKSGMIPYSAGAVFLRADLDGFVSRPAHYTLSGTDNTLLGSRSGAMAVACWAFARAGGDDLLRDAVRDGARRAGDLASILEGFRNVQRAWTIPSPHVCVTLTEEGRGDDALLKVLRDHSMSPSALIARADRCPEVGFPVYLMPHTDDGAVDELAERWRSLPSS